MRVPAGAVAFVGVNHFLVIIDDAFPRSQPRVVAPQADHGFAWPHIEPQGLLCLKATLLGVDPGQRILQHILWAQDLLNCPDEDRRHEFEREFSSYWNQRVSEKRGRTNVLSLLRPGTGSREIVYFTDVTNRRLVVADDRAELMTWLRHSGANPGNKQLLPGWLVWLPRPWLPSEFPVVGCDVLKLLPAETVARLLRPGHECPVVFGTLTPTGVVFAAAMLESAPKRDLTKGFRDLTRIPANRIVASFAARPVRRCPVFRVDGAWIHGRDHDEGFTLLCGQTVSIVGCGALGAAVARLLAQAGVGRFILVDPDDFAPHNTSRHVLGQRHSGKNKASATAEMLMEDFPYIKDAVHIPQRFEALQAGQLEALATADLIISAGLDTEGDASLDTWRRGLSKPPIHLCAWAEEFAIVGHAVALFGVDSLLEAFDETEHFRFRLTDWPEGSGALIVEAGCGNVFQPHGAVDLMSTISNAASLALDVLSAKVTISSRRVWMGDRDEVLKRGGMVKPEFTDNRCVKDYPWP